VVALRPGIVRVSNVCGVGVLDELRERRLTRPDGRIVAWTEWGPPEGIPLLRLPGTPGCRLSVRSDTTPWAQRGLRVITTERPGLGASSRLPGRGFAEHADDLAAVLDELRLEAVHVTGASGASAHELCFAGRHPGRVRAMTIVAGGAPATLEESEQEISLNREAAELVRAGDLATLWERLDKVYRDFVADPLAAIGAVSDGVPAADRAVMSAPSWQVVFTAAVREALRPGPDGWGDETVALLGDWADVDCSAVRTSLTWWHSPADADATLSAARRLLARIPHAQLRLFGSGEGHLAGFHREADILDELLARG
jgi:pimeloyl-ACP methyl ester carboxylesterase